VPDGVFFWAAWLQNLMVGRFAILVVQARRLYHKPKIRQFLQIDADKTAKN